VEATSPYDARTVANFILNLADASSMPLTQVKLYKIIYFAHGWYLSSWDKPLISQYFEAWEYGPVVRVLYSNFKLFKGGPIKSRAKKFNIYKNSIEEIEESISSLDAKFIGDVFSEYRNHTAWQLSDMTHVSGSPWDTVWNSSEGIGRVGLRLKNSEIRRHFLASYGSRS